jgi:hypothetical protein
VPVGGLGFSRRHLFTDCSNHAQHPAIVSSEESADVKLLSSQKFLRSPSSIAGISAVLPNTRYVCRVLIKAIPPSSMHVFLLNNRVVVRYSLPVLSSLPTICGIVHDDLQPANSWLWSRSQTSATLRGDGAWRNLFCFERIGAIAKISLYIRIRDGVELMSELPNIVLLAQCTEALGVDWREEASRPSSLVPGVVASFNKLRTDVATALDICKGEQIKSRTSSASRWPFVRLAPSEADFGVNRATRPLHAIYDGHGLIRSPSSRRSMPGFGMCTRDLSRSGVRR